MPAIRGHDHAAHCRSAGLRRRARPSREICGRPRNATIPVLSTVLLRTGDGEVEITATNLDHLFRATIEARVEAEGAIAAKADLLAGFVRGAAGTDVEVALAGSLLEVRSGHARGRIPTLAADEFPEPLDTERPTSASTSTAQCRRLPRRRRLRGVRGMVALLFAGTSWSIQDGRLELAPLTGKSCR